MQFQDLATIFSFSISSGEVLVNLIIALICGLLIALFYRWTYIGPNYSKTFVHSLVIITMITSIVIMVIGNNLARAFGLVGAMSIIRFRTAVKDTHDIVFIFYALAIGLASGVGLTQVAFTGVLFIGLVVLVMHYHRFGSKKKRHYLLQFSAESTLNGDPPYLELFHQFCRENRLINVRSLGQDDRLELSFYILLKDLKNQTEFIRMLSRVEGVTNINFYFDDEEG